MLLAVFDLSSLRPFSQIDSDESSGPDVCRALVFKVNYCYNCGIPADQEVDAPRPELERKNMPSYWGQAVVKLVFGVD